MRFLIIILACLALWWFWLSPANSVKHQPGQLVEDSNTPLAVTQVEVAADPPRVDLRQQQANELLARRPELEKFREILISEYQLRDTNSKQELLPAFMGNAGQCAMYAQKLAERNPETYSWLLDEPWMEGSNSRVCFEWKLVLGRLHETMQTMADGPYGGSQFDMYRFDKITWQVDVRGVAAYLSGKIWDRLPDEIHHASAKLHEEHLRSAMKAYIEYKRWKGARFDAYNNTKTERTEEVDRLLAPEYLQAKARIDSFKRSYLEDVRKLLHVNGIITLR